MEWKHFEWTMVNFKKRISSNKPQGKLTGYVLNSFGLNKPNFLSAWMLLNGLQYKHDLSQFHKAVQLKLLLSTEKYC